MLLHAVRPVIWGLALAMATPAAAHRAMACTRRVYHLGAWQRQFWRLKGSCGASMAPDDDIYGACSAVEVAALPAR